MGVGQYFFDYNAMLLKYMSLLFLEQIQPKRTGSDFSRLYKFINRLININ